MLAKAKGGEEPEKLRAVLVEERRRRAQAVEEVKKKEKGRSMATSCMRFTTSFLFNFFAKSLK